MEQDHGENNAAEYDSKKALILEFMKEQYEVVEEYANAQTLLFNAITSTTANTTHSSSSTPAGTDEEDAGVAVSSVDYFSTVSASSFAATPFPTIPPYFAQAATVITATEHLEQARERVRTNLQQLQAAIRASQTKNTVTGTSTTTTNPNKDNYTTNHRAARILDFDDTETNNNNNNNTNANTNTNKEDDDNDGDTNDAAKNTTRKNSNTTSTTIPCSKDEVRRHHTRRRRRTQMTDRAYQDHVDLSKRVIRTVASNPAWYPNGCPAPHPVLGIRERSPAYVHNTDLNGPLPQNTMALAALRASITKLRQNCFY